MRRNLLFAGFCGLALAAGACGELPDVTTVQDLRVLAVKCEPAGFLVDLDDPGGFMKNANGADPATLRAQITALVADPLAPGGMLSITAAGCPDYIDTITSATGQGTKLCPPPSAVSQLPDPIKTDLTTDDFITADMPLVVPASPGMDYVFQPTVSFGLTPKQIHDFFSPTPTGIPQLDQSIAYNRDFSLPAIVNLSFDINGEHAVAIKNVVYWPKLDPNEAPNTNPTLAGLLFYKHRNADTGDPEDLYPDPNPTLSIASGDKLYVQPDYLPNPSSGYPGAVDTNYLLRVKNTQTDQIETTVVPRELIRFQFYATAGTFSPDEQQSEIDPLLAPGSRLHTDSQYNLPKASELPADGQVRIWVVTRDERAGSDWFSTTITVVPQ